MKKILLSSLLIFVLFIQSCSSFFTGEKENKFITVKGTHFIKDGEPYYFVGTNLWYGCYLGSPGETGDRERLKTELDMLKDIGVTNLRILAASEESYIKNSLRPAIQKEPGIYDEDLLEGLDFLLAEMGKRDMQGVIFLNNYWEWSGGMAQYNAWFGADNPVDPGNPQQGWVMFMNYSATFYRNKAANDYFQEYIKKIVTRKNKFNGFYYFEDPVIMAWQLANEPRPGEGETGEKYVEPYYKWIDETAAYIHSIDPNHLVTTGSEGTRGSLDIPEVYLKAHQSKNIDYMTFHLWAKNWSWYKADNPEETFPVTLKKAEKYFNDHLQYARETGKPITLEEFGLGRDFEKYSKASPATYRDKYFAKMFELVYDSAKAGAPIAGTNFWSWGGVGEAQHDDYKWRPGDPFTGDPPQEPQGLNSVFAADVSTLKILKEHSDNMHSL